MIFFSNNVIFISIHLYTQQTLYKVMNLIINFKMNFSLKIHIKNIANPYSFNFLGLFFNFGIIIVRFEHLLHSVLEINDLIESLFIINPLLNTIIDYFTHVSLGPIPQILSIYDIPLT